MAGGCGQLQTHRLHPFDITIVDRVNRNELHFVVWIESDSIVKYYIGWRERERKRERERERERERDQ